jgi:hypothetical protein
LLQYKEVQYEIGAKLWVLVRESVAGQYLSWISSKLEYIEGEEGKRCQCAKVSSLPYFTWWLGPFRPLLHFTPAPLRFSPIPLRIRILHLPSLYRCNIEVLHNSKKCKFWAPRVCFPKIIMLPHIVNVIVWEQRTGNLDSKTSACTEDVPMKSESTEREKPAVSGEWTMFAWSSLAVTV